jgi:hypothetical protein
MTLQGHMPVSGTTPPTFTHAPGPASRIGVLTIDNTLRGPEFRRTLGARVRRERWNIWR